VREGEREREKEGYPRSKQSTEHGCKVKRAHKTCCPPHKDREVLQTVFQQGLEERKREWRESSL
jgi:hypothetical protein